MHTFKYNPDGFGPSDPRKGFIRIDMMSGKKIRASYGVNFPRSTSPKIWLKKKATDTGKQIAVIAGFKKGSDRPRQILRIAHKYRNKQALLL